MPANSSRATVDAFRSHLQRVVSCVTDHPLHITGYRPSPIPHQMTFLPVDDPPRMRLRRASGRLRLSIRIDYQVDFLRTASQNSIVRLTGYSYRVLESEGREIIVYHWHPLGRSSVRSPHLHLSSRVSEFSTDANLLIALAEMHIPTGFVTLADVVRLLITEFSVEPRRADWDSILNEEAPASSAR